MHHRAEMKRTQVFILVLLFAAGLFVGQAFGNFMVNRVVVLQPGTAIYVRPFVPVFDGLIEEDMSYSCDSREP
jgi:hypothetical protein